MRKMWHHVGHQKTGINIEIVLTSLYCVAGFTKICLMKTASESHLAEITAWEQTNWAEDGRIPGKIDCRNINHET